MAWNLIRWPTRVVMALIFSMFLTITLWILITICLVVLLPFNFLDWLEIDKLKNKPTALR